MLLSSRFRGSDLLSRVKEIKTLKTLNPKPEAFLACSRRRVRRVLREAMTSSSVGSRSAGCTT